jgi:hypothetical protein
MAALRSRAAVTIYAAVPHCNVTEATAAHTRGACNKAITHTSTAARTRNSYTRSEHTCVRVRGSLGNSTAILRRKSQPLIAPLLTQARE